MKICCDACSKEEASVFCAADEASLCISCDQRVHQANMLAIKHVRFLLICPSLKESPLCDICQERRAFMFCKEDRAILCRECDIPIHKTNQHTQKHNRFLLTGVKLWPQSSSPSSACPDMSSSNDSETIPYISNQFSSYNTNDQNQYCSISNNVHDQSSMSTGSISEYLMETLPGWQVDDFLGPSHGFCKIPYVQNTVSVSDHVFENNFYPAFGNPGIWVPQAPPQPSNEEHIKRNLADNGYEMD